MKCPFLKRSEAFFCSVADTRKILPSCSSAVLEQRCSSSQYITCPTAREFMDSNEHLSGCPFLRSTEIQFCAAALSNKLIPIHNTISKCTSDASLFCDHRVESGSTESKHEPWPGAEDILAPSHLQYFENHMWLHLAENGFLHIGLDAFLTTILGKPDSICFVSQGGLAKPAVVLTVNNVDMLMIFPKRLHITRVNKELELNPGLLTDSPYNKGWLFEYAPFDTADGLKHAASAFGMMAGIQARQWMQNEVDRINDFLENIDEENSLLNMAHRLPCEELVHLHTAFFTTGTPWKACRN